MARLTANGAIVSDSGEWYHTGYQWRPLVASPAGRPPTLISPEGKQLAGLTRERQAALGWRARTVDQAGEELVALVARHGSLDAAERALEAPATEAEPVRPANYGLRSEDGRWWWDGQRWQPVGST